MSKNQLIVELIIVSPNQLVNYKGSYYVEADIVAKRLFLRHVNESMYMYLYIQMFK